MPLAPEFPDALTWLNTARPLRLGHELRGHLVLLHFWSYTNIHCIHVLADMRHLQAKYAQKPLALIGIHASKYEAGAAAVRAAIQRHGIRHPVVVDTRREIWEGYGITTWPTLVLVGPDGKMIGVVSGEGHRTLLENAIDRAFAGGSAAFAAHPLSLPPIDVAVPEAPLRFPTKILADRAKGRLIVLDSGHHRILVTSWPESDANITVQQVIGLGKAGAEDGDFTAATFNDPQGAIMGGGGGETLYVADTGNHLIRRVDLKAQRVQTILGTGEQRFEHEAGKSGREQPLNSPWDPALLANRLYISQAGQHQIFAMNLMTGMTEVAAGTAREGLRDGAALGANLAQPAGLALDPVAKVLYFIDAQSSALRALDLQTKQVSTLIGAGVFDFGDADGDRQSARLKHPLGLAFTHEGKGLLLADTLNDKIKIYHLSARTLETLAPATGDFNLSEPSGVVPVPTADSPHNILIADTNHHRILQLNVASGEWRTLQLAW